MCPLNNWLRNRTAGAAQACPPARHTLTKLMTRRMLAAVALGLLLGVPGSAKAPETEAVPCSSIAVADCMSARPEGATLATATEVVEEALRPSLSVTTTVIS